MRVAFKGAFISVGRCVHVLGSLRFQEPELEGTRSPGEVIVHKLRWQTMAVFD